MPSKVMLPKRTKQQREALKYFDRKASEWDLKARGQGSDKVNVIEQRNQYVLKVVAQREKTEYALDVGCGVGDLVCALALIGVKATGIDIAGGMVELARRRAADSKVVLAEFVEADYFNYRVANTSYDLIAANGFIEYVSYQQRDAFLSSAYRALKPGGSLVVSSRNRLFNLFSANSYSLDEIKAKAVDKLLSECVALARGDSVERLLKMRCAPLQKERIKHESTGIEVTTRYQYTPVQMMKIIRGAGFEAVDISPIHIHAAVPMFKNVNPKAHVQMAAKLQGYALNNRTLLPNASAFMIHARKGRRDN